MKQWLQALSENNYPGRGIILGVTPDGKQSVAAYFIMGRSENSRNRVFVETPDGIRTEAFDAAKLVDPSLVIYAPVRKLGNALIVTNGDQTDTIYDYLSRGSTFKEALETRTFEPDPPLYTPRVSGMLVAEKERFSYSLSILKSNRGNPDAALRFFFEYETPCAGEGHFIHTYREDGNPVPSFEGEPKTVTIHQDIDLFTSELWAALNEDNKVSLYVRYENAETRESATRIVNKHIIR